MIRFGEFTWDEEASLQRAGTPVKLQPKVHQLLGLLLSEPGKLWTREALDERIWSDVTVTEDSLSQAMRRLRVALCDERKPARFVETVPRRGYRWVSPVVVDGESRPLERRPLPRPDDRFFGRQGERAALLDALGRSRLVTVVGPGGIGKTRLARELPEVERWCRLGAVTDAAGLYTAMADGLGLPVEAAGPDQVRAALAASDGLVLLDEAEGASELVAGAVADWLAASPAVRFLVTSRIRLGLAAERCVELGPLPADDAIALYLDRSAAVDPGAQDADADVRGLVTLLDGFPLAVELAAARRTVLGAGALRDRLDASLGVLAAGWGDRPPRHRSLTEALAWSWSLLSPDDRRAAARLAAFVGGLSLELGEAALSDLDDPLGRLDALRRASWLVQTGERLDQYALVRRFVAEEASDLRDEAVARQAAAMVAWAGRHLGAPTAAIAEERANLWAALRAATEPEDVIVLCLAVVRVELNLDDDGPMFGALDRAVELAGARTDLASRALALRSRHGLRRHRERAVADARRALDLAGDDPTLRSTALVALGLALPPGDAEAEEALDEALLLAQRAGAAAPEAAALQHRARLLAQRGRLVEAAARVAESVAAWERVGTTWQLARALELSSQVAAWVDDLDLARRSALRALELLDPLHDAMLYAAALVSIARLALREGRAADAESLAVEIGAVASRSWLSTPEAPAWIRSALAVEAGDLDGARRILAEVPPPATAMGRAEHGSHELLLLVAEERWDDADQNLAWRSVVYRDAGFRPGELMAWAWRALVSGARGDPAAARRWSDAVREFADPALGPMVETWIRLADLGPVLAAADDDGEARAVARAEASAILALAPLGPTTGQPAPTPEVRAALRLVIRGSRSARAG